MTTANDKENEKLKLATGVERMLAWLRAAPTPLLKTMINPKTPEHLRMIGKKADLVLMVLSEREEKK